ncbi:cellulose binding domain-containing protein [Micromonospora sagamiensis]|uniref:Cellulose binding domain-containing protein n=1 Tax=Micromonospora sagamiensis TaxID=47875 RepID=A0A562WE12_9ACTN|nr:cellulose binding domain-containing protein [Micromonospora sagamiensis]TWJ28365.1 cellulose binding domain-containing protein [Micromonospora sagamiensis]BCL12743.1 hypothetical protein GCM10017556_04820 [Micromonospora sagamiensis]
MAGRRRARNGSTAGLLSPWAVVSVGVLVMVVLLGVALGTVVSSRPSAAPGPPPEPGPLPALSASSFAASRSAAPTASRTVRPSRTPSASPSRTVSPTPSRSPSPTAASSGPAVNQQPSPAQVTGTYRPVETYDGAFIGEVRLTNLSTAPRSWTVRVEVPGARLVSAWTEGTAQAGSSGSRGTFTFTSGADLAPGASASLRFHLRDTGTATRPTSCTVDGAPCGR